MPLEQARGWVYSAAAGARFPPGVLKPVKVPAADGVDSLEWFRPTEVNFYSDIRNVTHEAPLAEPLHPTPHDASLRTVLRSELCERTLRRLLCALRINICCSAARARLSIFMLHTALLCTAATLAPANATQKNVVLLVIDNLRPALGAYGDEVAKTPRIDAWATGPHSTIFSRAYCQLSHCAPSRNSFLVGRRPDETHAWNFNSSFRDVGPDWVTLPGYFMRNGYYTTSIGKVFHHNLPPNDDYPQSWSDVPLTQTKHDCGPPGHSAMGCELPAGDPDFDAETADVAIGRLKARPRGQARHAPASYGRRQREHLPHMAALLRGRRLLGRAAAINGQTLHV